MRRIVVLLSILFLLPLSGLAQETQIDSLKNEIKELEKRVKKLEKEMGPGFSSDYYDDIEHAFIALGYYQGTYAITDSTNSVQNFGLNLQYAEDKISVVADAAWGDGKFFSSFYIGYNFYGKNNRVSITPMIGAITWGDNFWDFNESIWSYGIAITLMKNIPLSFSMLNHEKGVAFSVSYRFDL